MGKKKEKRTGAQVGKSEIYEKFTIRKIALIVKRRFL